MLQLFMDKQFIPVIGVVIAALVILLIRPSFLVYSSKDPSCPYCLNPWLTSLVLIVIGAFIYAFINQDGIKPSINMYQNKF